MKIKIIVSRNNKQYTYLMPVADYQTAKRQSEKIKERGIYLSDKVVNCFILEY